MKDKKQLPLEQKEKAVHGERIFPLKKYLTTLQERYPIVTPHWHEEAEFTLITSGVCTYQVDLESFQAMPGDFRFHSSTGSAFHCHITCRAYAFGNICLSP